VIIDVARDRSKVAGGPAAGGPGRAF